MIKQLLLNSVITKCCDLSVSQWLLNLFRKSTIMISYTYYSLVAANEAKVGTNSTEMVWPILLVHVDCYP